MIFLWGLEAYKTFGLTLLLTKCVSHWFVLFAEIFIDLSDCGVPVETFLA